MDTLEAVIQTLTSDEVRRFKILSNRFKADEEKKLLVLFDSIRSEKYAGREEHLLLDLYGITNAKTKNRYYRLRNKLLDNLEKSLVFYHFKYKDSIHAYYDIQLAIMFKERGNLELSKYFLRKGEKKALLLDQFNILEIVYGEFVQLAFTNIDIEIKQILEKRKKNLKKLEIHRHNTEAIAIIKQELKRSKIKGTKGSVLELLEMIKKDIEKSADIFHSPDGKILLFQTVSTILHSKGAWPQLVEYLFETIRHFEENELFNQDNHTSRLLMRLRLIISLYNSYRLNEAAEQLSVFEREMKMFNKQNFNTYLFNYYNIRIYNLKLLGKSVETRKAIDEALSIPEIRNNPANRDIILISLAGQQFNEGDFSGALQTIRDIQDSKGYAEFDPSLRCYLDLFKMVNQFEVSDFGDALENYKKFRKRFRKLLKTAEHQKAARFGSLLARMIEAGISGKRVSLRAAVRGFEEKFTESLPHENEIVNPLMFLKSKLERRPYHKIFLDEVRKREST